MNKLSDEEIYRLRDLASGEDEKDYSIAVDSKTLFEMCVELEIHRYDGFHKRVTELELELEDVRNSRPFIGWVKITTYYKTIEEAKAAVENTLRK